MGRARVADSRINDFQFLLIGDEKTPFLGYNSSSDPTRASAQFMVQGSQNSLLTRDGTIAVREGRKRRGPANTALAGVKASFEYKISSGLIRPVFVANGAVQVEVDVTGAGNYEYVNLVTGLDEDQEHFVFDTWWDDANKKDRLIFVHQTADILSWSGGVGLVSSATPTTVIVSGTTSLAKLSFDSSGTILINGHEYAYTAIGVSETNAFQSTSTGGAFQFGATGQMVSQIFTTGASAKTITKVNGTQMQIEGGAPSVDEQVQCDIYTDNGGVPGTSLGSTTTTKTTSGGSNADFTFTFNIPVVVSPGTSYHVVLKPTTFGSAFNHALTTGTTAGLGTYTSVDNGTTWVAHVGYLYVTVVENDASDETFIGVSPDPSAEAAGSIVVQKVTLNSNLPNIDFRNDFVKTINNQLYVGSYTSRQAYVSSNSDYTTFTVPTVRAAGDPDLLTFDSTLRAFSVQKGNSDTNVAIISGSEGDWYSVVRSNVTVGTTLTEQVQVVKSDTSDLGSAKNHEFVDNIGDSIVFLDDTNQLRIYGTVRNIVTPVYPELSLDVHDEFVAEDFTDGHLRAVGDTIFITAPLSGKDYMYQIRQRLDPLGNVSAERVWQPPQIRGISRIAVISGTVFGYSVANPQLYQLFGTNQWHDDSPSDESLPYRVVARFAYENMGRYVKFAADKLYTEGYMSENSELGGNRYLDYLGATDIESFDVNDPLALNTGLTPTFFPEPSGSSLGDESLGDGSLGDGGGSDVVEYPKFRTIITVSDEETVFEHQVEFVSEQADARWELLAFGFNSTVSPVDSPSELLQGSV